MKKISVLICVYLWLIFPIFAQEFTQISDGIEHAQFVRKIKDEPVNVNLLRLDLTKVRLDVVHALDAAIGLETTSSIATRHGAIVAINAGFFKIDGLYKGDAAGVLQIDGKLLSESFGNRSALFINNKSNLTEIAIEKLKADTYLQVRKGLEGMVITRGINRQRSENDFVIYTPEFHRTTLTDNNGTEIVVERNKVVKTYAGKGSNLIPSDGFVISLSGSFVNDLRGLSKIGKEIKYSGFGLFQTFSNQNISTDIFKEDIVGGVPQLIKNGKIEITWQEEKSSKDFVETRHPRTAVAKLKDGKFLMVTVDGRQPNVSIGMNLQELAEMLLELGATDAMNLDGGGSTTMFVKDKVVNLPSDKTGERAVSDAILVTLRKKN